MKLLNVRRHYRAAAAGAAALGCALFVNTAQAVSVIDAALLTQMDTDVRDTVTAIMAVVIPLVVLLLATFIGIKIVKRGANKV